MSVGRTDPNALPQGECRPTLQHALGVLAKHPLCPDRGLMPPACAQAHRHVCLVSKATLWSIWQVKKENT